MLSSNISLGNLKPDLRSARTPRVQRGLFIRLMRIVILVSLDAASISLAWVLSGLSGTNLDIWTAKTLSFLLLNLGLTLAIFQTTGLYDAGVHRRNYWGVIKGISLSSILLFFINFIYTENRHFAYTKYLAYWLLALVFICGYRYLFNFITNFFRVKGAIRHRIFIIADEEDREEYYIKLLERENYFSIQDYADARCLDLANREMTFEYLRKKNIDQVFISWNSIKNRLFLCWHFYNAGITVRMLPTIGEFSLPKSTFDMIGEVFFPTIPAPIIVGGDFWMKRCFDLCFSFTLIILLSPLYLLIAIVVKLDSPGPIFFRQKRVGLHGKAFEIWKFRTMVTNAEKIQASLEAKNEIKDGVLFKIKDDPRITKVGKFLRRYSLDELPQLFNVFLGEMSLVGPRPLPLRDVEKFKTRHFIRQEVLPGITGLWQVSGRSNIDNFEDAFKLDMDYIENWSLWLDLRILLQTFQVVVQKTGAH
ncbi:sugar transferase [Anabaena azotica]|uniref:Sugar transferase n=1 Tax=Anabaena azotica FACHB-119 TaxID=947527 RepID=A0ABR8DEX9_9NOST|nr:sugar transferase [Anabaena azotica]MBD2504263.1 sugar transferase [Anabaena azotica FACHB-119]